MEFDFLNLILKDEIFRYFLIANTSFALFIWIFNLITSNISHMDRLWGILPSIWASGFLYAAVTLNPGKEENSGNNYSILKSDDTSISRLILMAFLIAIWGIRICYVFYRRGYYSWGHEDHRWEEIRYLIIFLF